MARHLVSNIHKYYLAYQMMSGAAQARAAAKNGRQETYRPSAEEEGANPGAGRG